MYAPLEEALAALDRGVWRTDRDGDANLALRPVRLCVGAVFLGEFDIGGVAVVEKGE